MKISVNLQFNDGGTDPPVAEDWLYILPDFLQQPGITGSYYPIRDSAVKLGGAPCIVVINEDSIPLTKEWQQFIATCMALSRYNKLWTPPNTTLNWLRPINPVRLAVLKFAERIQRARNLIDSNELTVEERDQVEKCFTGTLETTVAYCNGQGFPGRANWVTMQDLDKELPKYDKMRTNGTVCHKGFKTQDDKGKTVYELEGFIWEDGPPAVTDRSILADPRIFWATIIRNNKLTNNPVTYAVNRFPRLDGGSVPLPLIHKRGQPLQCPWIYVSEYTGERRPLYWPPTETPWVS